MLSGDITRDARLRAGPSQTELGQRVGRDRTQIARWERHAVAPSLETLGELVQACGYDPSLRLEPLTARTAKSCAPRSCSRRRNASSGCSSNEADRRSERLRPLAILCALERHRVAYVLVGNLAGVLHGTDLTADTVEITPSLRPENTERLAQVLDNLGVSEKGRAALQAFTPESPSFSLATHKGEIVILAVPPGTGGFEDLRRAAQREPLGQGIRAPVASSPDLIRSIAAEGHDAVLEQPLRRLVDLERGLSVQL